MVNDIPNEDMPTIPQYSNACGLASLLMVLKPEARGIAPILNLIAKNHGGIIDRQESPGKVWQQVLELLLIKACVDPRLQNILKRFYKKEFNNSILPLLEGLLARSGINPQKIGHNSLMKGVFTIKDQVELTTIALMLGCSFLPYRRNLDGTGALFLDPKHDLQEQWTIKLDSLCNTVNIAQNPVLCCNNHHWVAIKVIQPLKKKILVIDPAGGNDANIQFNNLNPWVRFYLYQFSAKDLQCNQLILEALDEDSVTES